MFRIYRKACMHWLNLVVGQCLNFHCYLFVSFWVLFFFLLSLIIVHFCLKKKIVRMSNTPDNRGGPTCFAFTSQTDLDDGKSSLTVESWSLVCGKFPTYQVPYCTVSGFKGSEGTLSQAVREMIMHYRVNWLDNLSSIGCACCNRLRCKNHLIISWWFVICRWLLPLLILTQSD